MRKVRPTVVIADDVSKSLDVWKTVLKKTCRVVAAAADGTSALEAIRQFKPDVAVLDINMPGMSGLEVAQNALIEQPPIGIILCSVMGDQGIVEAAAEAGVRGYVSKSNVSHQLSDAVATVAAGGKFFPPPIPLPYTSKAKVHEPETKESQDQIVRALRRSEYRLRQALEANSEGVWDWNIPTGQAYFSAGYARLLGFEPEEFPTDYAGWKELVHPDDFERVNREHAAHIHEDKPFCIDFRMRKKTGDWCWIRSRGVVIERDAAGNAVRMLGTHTDITDFKRLEKDLRKRERELAEAQRITRVGSWTRNANGVLEWSDELYRIHGLDPRLGPLAFAEMSHLFTPESWERMKAGRKVLFEDGIFPCEDLEIIRTDGSHGWVATHGEIDRDETGQMVQVRGTVQDISERKETERRLREYQRAIESVEEMIVVVDREYRYVIANRAYLDYVGKTADQVIGRTIPEIVGEELFEKVIKSNLDRNFEGQSVHYEVEHHLRDFGRRMVFASQLPIEGPHGVDRVLAILQDITELQKREKELREREAGLRDAQRIAHIGSWTWDPETDAMTWSDELYAITRWDRNVPIPHFREMEQFFDSDDFRRLEEAVQTTLLRGVPYELEMEARRVDGEAVYFVTRGEAIYSADGSVSYLRGTTQDITDRHLAEMAIKESEERFRTIADSAPVNICLTDAHNRIVYVNKKWLDYTGVASTSQLDEEWAGRLHPDDAFRVIQQFDDAFHRRVPVTLEYRLRGRDGQYRWLIDTAVPRFEADGAFAGYIGSSVDDTERREVEQVRRGIGGRLIHAQELERKRIGRELHDDVGQRLALLAVEIKQIESAPDISPEIRMRVNEISSQISDLSVGVQALSHRLHSSSLVYLGLERAIKGHCDELMRHHRVMIDYEHSDVPKSLSPDVSLALFRITQEALQNAIKYSGAREFFVRLLGDADRVLLTIRDQGIGFVLKDAMQGQGLGLISMKERITAFRGELTIISEPNHGTEITARVPLAAQQSHLAETSAD